MKCAPEARGGQDAAFTQPREYYLADPCNLAPGLPSGRRTGQDLLGGVILWCVEKMPIKIHDMPLYTYLTVAPIKLTYINQLR